MPPTPNARINFAEIMQAAADQLLADAVVSDASQITWGTPGKVPQLTGPFDVLLVARAASHSPYDAGAGQLMLVRLLDVWIRSEPAMADPGGGVKTWLGSVFALSDKILDSIGNDSWWPEDAFGNFLSIESVKLVGDAAPEQPRAGGSFGDYCCTLSCTYFPNTDPMKGP